VVVGVRATTLLALKVGILLKLAGSCSTYGVY